MESDRTEVPHFTPNGQSLVELAYEANRSTPDTGAGTVKLAEYMGLVIMQPGHPARREVLEYLTQFGQGAMLGLIPVQASTTAH